MSAMCFSSNGEDGDINLLLPRPEESRLRRSWSRDQTWGQSNEAAFNWPVTLNGAAYFGSHWAGITNADNSATYPGNDLGSRGSFFHGPEDVCCDLEHGPGSSQVCTSGEQWTLCVECS